MAVSLLKTFISFDYKCDPDDNFSSPELKDWKKKAQEQRTAFCKSFTSCSEKDFGPLPGFSLNKKNIIIIHPFWNTKTAKGLLAKAEAEAKAEASNSIDYVDTFNLLRRPSYVYKNIT